MENPKPEATAPEPVAFRESVLIDSIGLPRTTYAAVKARGEGPRTFKIGRLNYVTRDDWESWLQSRAGAVASAT